MAVNISNLTIRHGIIRIDTRSNKWWIRLWQVCLSEQFIELVTQDSPKASTFAMANNCQLGYCMILLLLAHISAASQSSSLYEPNKAMSSASWSQYKTHSGPAVDVNQCLARCEQHHNDPSHSGYSLSKWDFD